MPGRLAHDRQEDGHGHGWIAGAALIATLAGPGIAAAATDDGPIAATVARLLEAEEIPYHRAVRAGRTSGRADPASAAADASGTATVQGANIGRRIAGAAVGAVGGAFAGGYSGAVIDGDCGGCDDPGFKGFLIGFPVGGVVGGVLGGLYLFR